MKTSDKGIKLIQAFEGFQPKEYICPAGKPTIGYGHVVQAGEKFGTLTEQEASELLVKDLERYETAILRCVESSLLQNEFDALASFTYNLGINAFQNSTLLKKLNSEDYESAANEFLKWDKATVNGKKVPLAGLTRRRQAERQMFLGDL